MFSQFEEKGKIFTAVITKKPVNVHIQTPQNLIKGTMHIRPDNRLKDEINQTETFLAVTNASILDLSGKLLYRSNFLAVNRSQIVWLLPNDEIQSLSES